MAFNEFLNGSAAAEKTALSLNNVENTALSTWAGSSNITTLGTITPGIAAGSVSPVVKFSTATGTLSSINGGIASLNLNADVAPGKIISLTGGVDWSTQGGYFPPGFPATSVSNYGFNFYEYGTAPLTIDVYNALGNAANIYGKTITILCIYTT